MRCKALLIAGALLVSIVLPKEVVAYSSIMDVLCPTVSGVDDHARNMLQRCQDESNNCVVTDPTSVIDAAITRDYLQYGLKIARQEEGPVTVMVTDYDIGLNVRRAIVAKCLEVKHPDVSFLTSL